ncbi:phosphopantetheine adenylyltransferase [Pseudomonadales bacterium]|nr:phosphopantetheine adenylyltransferase [Pseudomonadales bacterium]
MGKAVIFCLVVVGLINLAPVIGVISTQKLESAYSVTLAGNDLAILVRHRALLFGILGAFILYSAFSPRYQPAAMIMAAASMVGFAWLVLSTGGYNEAIRKVLFIDILGILFLLAAVVLKYGVRSS